MKRIITFVLAMIIMFSISTPSFANLDDKLGNHWSRGEIDRDFLLYYFSYLAREDFKRLNPNEAIREDEFLLSFSSLLKNKGYATVELEFRQYIKRIEMVKIVGDKLIDIAEFADEDVELPFTDIEDITDEELVALKKLYSLGIIQGQSNSKLNPFANTTQAEAIVVLQRVRDYLNNLKVEEEEEEVVTREVPFNLSGTIQAYTGEEGIIAREKENSVIVTITKMLPTPGYTVKVDKIVEKNGEYKVYLDITPPDKNMELPQVIVYKTITIEIEKDELGEPPYKFVWG